MLKWNGFEKTLYKQVGLLLWAFINKTDEAAYEVTAKYLSKSTTLSKFGHLFLLSISGVGNGSYHESVDSNLKV